MDDVRRNFTASTRHNTSCSEVKTNLKEFLHREFGLTSHQQLEQTETKPWFKASSERPAKPGINLASPGFVVQRVSHHTTDYPVCKKRI